MILATIFAIEFKIFFWFSGIENKHSRLSRQDEKGELHEDTL